MVVVVEKVSRCAQYKHGGTSSSENANSSVSSSSNANVSSSANARSRVNAFPYDTGNTTDENAASGDTPENLSARVA